MGHGLYEILSGNHRQLAVLPSIVYDIELDNYMINCEYATSALRRDSYKINQVYKSIPCSYQSKFLVKLTAEN